MGSNCRDKAGSEYFTAISNDYTQTASRPYLREENQLISYVCASYFTSPKPL
jgi:hypothetical protein